MFAGPAGAVTFTEDVAPIVFNNCTACHRPGEAAPFSFTNYEQVRKRARMIAEVTADRYMPPWHAEKADVRYHGERRLSAEQIETLSKWAEAGAPEGDPEKLPALPEFQQGWQLGQPDLVVEMTEVFEVPASGPDIYRNFVVPLNLDEDKWVKAIEFRPGAPSVVHHSLFYYDTSGEARRLDADSSKPGFAKMGRFARENILGGWAVGGIPKPLPDGLAYALPKGADLILASHFHPAGKVEYERSKVGIYFADKPPVKAFVGIQLPPQFGATSNVDIPAGEKSYVKRDQFELPVATRAFGVSAHAHYLGKTMRMNAVLPNGERKVLLRIDEWDFDWQEEYMFDGYVDLPAGTRIESEVVWDNSADNPHNPNDPPKRVRWGRESGDEMGSITLLVVAEEERQFRSLSERYRGHVRRVSREGLQAMRESAEEEFGSIPKAILERHRARFDKDGDGKLTGDERKAALAAWRKYRESSR